jgi:RNA polymerase sigma-70 factor (ECF subfamily)
LEFHSFDRQYLRNLAERDRETERHFVSYFSNLLNIKLRQRVRSRELVEDLRQEVFLRVLRSLERNGLEHPERLGAFVNAVCNHVLLEHYRAQGKAALPLNGWDDSLPEPVEPNADSEKDLLGAESRRQVRAVIPELPPRDQAILRALFFEERDKDTICQDYGVGRDYLRVLLHRAKVRLRGLLAEGSAGARAQGAAG